MRTNRLKFVPLTTALATTFVLSSAGVLPAQTASFVSTLGADTLSLEQYHRAADTITGDWVSLYGGVMVHHYRIVLRPDGTVARYDLELHRLSGKPDGETHALFGSDSVAVTTTGAEPVQVLGRPQFATFASTMAPVELIVQHARAAHADSSLVPVIAMFGSNRVGSVPFVFYGRDSVRYGNSRGSIYASVDANGRLLGVSARSTTTRTETRRVPDFNLWQVVRHFPNIPDSAPILGAPSISPRDTVRTTVGTASVTIDYGRPAVRGRAVFSRGVLGDTVWRVGANAATQLTTTRDLLVGGKLLRAGTYSVWMHVPPDNSSYALVFNSQAGQWGTEHHFERDLLSAPLSLVTARQPAERLTLVAEPHGATTTLHVRWGTTDLSAELGPVFAGTGSTGEALLQRMHDRYSGKWYNELTFTQRTTTWDQAHTKQEATWYESIARVGGRTALRIDRGNPSAGNGVLYTADSTWVMRNGALAGARANGNEFLPLIQGVYVQPVAQTAGELRREGFDLDKGYARDWKGMHLSVVGATQATDTTSAQFWVDDARDVLVRMIAPLGPNQFMDVSLGGYQPVKDAWLATHVEISIGGQLAQMEDYSDWRTDRGLSPALFDVKTWTTAPHWVK